MKNPLTLNAVIDWLKTKPADGEYVWIDSERCLVGTYLREIGVIHGRGDIMRGYNIIMGGLRAYGHIAASYPHTYGAALQRAERWRKEMI